jgi:hypothetical protein
VAAGPCGVKILPLRTPVELVEERFSPEDTILGTCRCLEEPGPAPVTCSPRKARLLAAVTFPARFGA